MLKVVNNGISLTRGDTATFRLQIKNQDGTDYEITPDDQVLFTVKRSPNDEEIVIQKAATNRSNRNWKYPTQRFKRIS